MASEVIVAKRTALLWASVSFALVGAADAQGFNPNLIGGVMSPVVVDPCPAGFPCGAHRAGAPPPHRLPRRHVQTTYRIDPAVTVRARRNFIIFVSRQAGDVAAAAVARNFAQNDPLQSWARQSAADGMRLGNVADAMAEYWVTNWQMANSSDHTTPAEVQGVRRQVAAVLADSPGFAALTPAGRQELAEGLIYNTLFQGDLYLELRRNGDARRLQAMSDGAENRFRSEAHLDLRSLALTERGLEKHG